MSPSACMQSLDAVTGSVHHVTSSHEYCLLRTCSSGRGSAYPVMCVGREAAMGRKFAGQILKGTNLEILHLLPSPCIVGSVVIKIIWLYIRYHVSVMNLLLLAYPFAQQ